jgi:hypothetical protein
MTEPTTSRPHMIDYGTLPATEGTGLLPWSWAEERLAASHDYWIGTTWPDGRPHISPVWGIWRDGAVWFSCGPNSRKARNLARDPRCSVATDNAYEPVIVDGVATLDMSGVVPFTELGNAKYEATNTVEFFAANHLYRVDPITVIGLTEADFAGSPTRWRFKSD